MWYLYDQVLVGRGGPCAFLSPAGGDAFLCGAGGGGFDTVVKKNTFAFTLNPGYYQWLVMAENGNSQTAYSPARSFTVVATSIKQQAVQLVSSANNLVTNAGSVIFQWGSLFGATEYRLEIDTNNFVNENAVIHNPAMPGEQLSFTFPEDQVYEWRVRAENDTNSRSGRLLSLVTYDHTPPP